MRSFAFFALVLLLATSAHAADAIRQFDFGSGHRCSLDSKGAVDCLGDSNLFGQLGNGGDESGSPRPVRAITHGARKVATGSFYTCAIVGDGLQCWGDIPPRKGGTRRPLTLIKHGVVDISAGDDRVCAIVSSAVKCVGMDGQSGSNEYIRAHPRPETVIASGATAVAAGSGFACAVVESALWCWGEVPSYAWHQQFAQSLPPTRVIERGVSAVAAGSKHVCAIMDGALLCWGDNSHGQVGVAVPAIPATNPPSDRSTASVIEGAQRCTQSVYTGTQCRVEPPVEVVHDGVEEVVAKVDATCAIVRGALFCWGRNGSGQLGIASHGADVTTPTLAIAHGVSYVATGARTCALVDGALQCSRPCVRTYNDLQCPPESGFDTHNLAFGFSGTEARLGIWRGTIGTHEIMACLQRPFSDAAYYYYVDHGTSLALTEAPGSDGVTWTETVGRADPSATWTLDYVDGSVLTGHWSDAADQRTLPIHLKRLVTSGDPGSACGIAATVAGRAYNKPRVEKAIQLGPWINQERSASALGDKINAFELADVPNAQTFNAAVHDWLSDQIAGYYDCTSEDPQGEYNSDLETEWRADPWIILRERYEAYCGGAHPSGGVASYWIWNMEQGRNVDPWRWIITLGTGAECPFLGCDSQPSNDLNDLIVAAATRNKDGDDCADSVNEYRKQGLYQLRPSAKGLIFSTDFAHVIQACDEDIEIPWAKLKPFLTREGKAAAKSLQEAAESSKTKQSTPIAPVN